MIATISPSIVAIEETLNTLKYANRAKNIKINIKKNVVESDYHISKYDEIIVNLKSEIEDLKKQLAEKGKNEVKFIETNLNTIKEEELNNIDKVQKDITNHFQEEIKIRKEIIDEERKIEGIKSEVSENEFNLYKSDNRKNEKMLKKVIAKLHANIDEFSSNLNELYIKQSSLMKKRTAIQKSIAKYTKDKSLQNGTMNGLYGKILLNTYKYYLSMIENMTHEHRKFVNANELKRRDHQIDKLRDQINLRDEFILNAANQLKSSKGNIKYANKNLHSLEEIDLDPMRLPVIVMGNYVAGAGTPQWRYEKKKESQLGGRKEKVKTPSPGHRQYNQELLPLLKNKKPIGKDSYLNRFKRIQNFRTENMRNENTGNNLHSSLDSSRRRVNNNNNNQGIRIEDEDVNISNTSILTGNDYRAVNRSHDSNISRLEMEMQQKVKTILRRDLIGRYKRSPYLRNMNN